MLVKELIEELKSLPQDAEVWMSSDGEGNRHSPLADLGKSLCHSEDGDPIHPDDVNLESYKDENAWGDETEEELRDDYEEWKSSLVTRVTLWPV